MVPMLKKAKIGQCAGISLEHLAQQPLTPMAKKRKDRTQKEEQRKYVETPKASMHATKKVTLKGLPKNNLRLPGKSEKNKLFQLRNSQQSQVWSLRLLNRHLNKALLSMS